MKSNRTNRTRSSRLRRIPLLPRSWHRSLILVSPRWPRGADGLDRAPDPNIAHQGGEDERRRTRTYAYDCAMADWLRHARDRHPRDQGRQDAVIHDSSGRSDHERNGHVYDMPWRRPRSSTRATGSCPGRGTDHSSCPAADYPFRGVRTGAVQAAAPLHLPTSGCLSPPQVMREYPDVPINIEIKGRSDDDVDSYLHNAEVLAGYLTASAGLAGSSSRPSTTRPSRTSTSWRHGSTSPRPRAVSPATSSATSRHPRARRSSRSR